MRLSTSSNICNFDRGQPYMVSFEDALRICAGAGYRYLDANLCGLARPGKKVSPLTQEDWAEKAKEWRQLADRLGITLLQGHAWWAIGHGVQQGENPGGEFGEEMMRRSVLAAEQLGIRELVVHPYSVFRGDTMLAEEGYADNLRYFSRWAAFFKQHNTEMAIENMVGKPGSENPSIWADVSRLCRLVDEIGEAHVGTCLDTGHAFLSGDDPAACARQMGSRLKATHIADNKGDRDAHVSPFMGSIDWPELIRALREIGYQNDFSFETQNLSACFPLAVQPGIIRFSYTLGEYLLSDALFTDIGQQPPV